MFRFEAGDYLWGLWIIPAVLMLYFAYDWYRKRQVSRLGASPLIQRLMPAAAKSWRQHLRITLISLTLLALLIALANPQWGNKKEKVEAQSADVFIALDISQSMMAEDVSPNRLERAKRLTESLIQQLRGNRIGLIYFAGSSYLQMPLTLDYSAAMMFAKSANTNLAATQGTAISEAIEMAEKAYQNEKQHQRALIIITDGESHDEAAITRAAAAHDNGLSIYTIGVGTSDGAFVPYTVRGQRQYKRDQDGRPVQSKLNITLVNELAAAGGGEAYFLPQDEDILNALSEAIEQLEKQRVETLSFTDYNSYFQYFLALSLFLLVVEWLWPEVISRKLSDA